MLTPGPLAPETHWLLGIKPLCPRAPFRDGTLISSTRHQGSQTSEGVRSCPGSWGEDCSAREGWAS